MSPERSYVAGTVPKIEPSPRPAYHLPTFEDPRFRPTPCPNPAFQAVASRPKSNPRSAPRVLVSVRQIVHIMLVESCDYLLKDAIVISKCSGLETTTAEQLRRSPKQFLHDAHAAVFREEKDPRMPFSTVTRLSNRRSSSQPRANTNARSRHKRPSAEDAQPTDAATSLAELQDRFHVREDAFLKLLVFLMPFLNNFDTYIRFCRIESNVINPA